MAVENIVIVDGLKARNKRQVQEVRASAALVSTARISESGTLYPRLVRQQGQLNLAVFTCKTSGSIT